jgi:fructose-bisphosphate aldolase, class I
MMEEIAELAARPRRRPRRRDLVVSARRQPVQGRRDGDRHLRLCRAHGGAPGRAHHQGEAADRDFLELEAAKKVYEQKIDISTLAARYRHVVQCCFAGKRIVVFSGGEAKDLDGVYDEARGIRDGGANGSIIGRNTFQRARPEALKLLDSLIRIYRGEA